nr:very short patch repair endonuclease [Micromonospora sp. DSM 115978]
MKGVGRVAGSWTSTEAGAHLRGRRSRDTAPELRLRQAVHAAGLRFRVHRTVLPRCTPDFVLPRWQLAVFVDGCFWHGCPDHGMKHFRGPNAGRWKKKFDNNRARDRRSDAELTAAGWRVLRIWECEVKRDVDAAAESVRLAAQFGTSLSRPAKSKPASSPARSARAS